MVKAKSDTAMVEKNKIEMANKREANTVHGCQSKRSVRFVSKTISGWYSLYGNTNSFDQHQVKRCKKIEWKDSPYAA